MLDIFQYGFMVRGLEAGIVVAIIAPLIGIFLVLRRYSLIADTLAHVSLAGIAIGMLLKVNPLISAIIAAVISSIAIERLRISKRIFGESALSIFLSGSLAIAVVIISYSHGFGVDLFSYLFGSITTVKQTDVNIIAGLGILVIATIIAFYKELLFVTIDEEAAKVNGIPTKFINSLLIVLAAFTIALSIPIVGVLLIAALIVIPVVTALLLKKSFLKTIFFAEAFSLISVLGGIIISFYLNLSPGGTIVLTAIAIFVFTLLFKKNNGFVDN